jgi:murein DD-endopeptidase MepM/ murein hydrolase activator NlpD
MLRRMQATPAGQKRLSQHFNGNFLRPVGGRITSGFGYRVHPILKVRKFHTGVDIGAASGTPIKAAADGIIIHAARWGGYGNCIIIDHGQGTATLYAHCSRLAASRGQAVNQGQVIGYVGSTGLSTGPHLHFEVRRNGTPVNPGL